MSSVAAICRHWLRCDVVSKVRIAARDAEEVVVGDHISSLKPDRMA